MKSTPIKWHGGKHYLAPWILEHSPEHIHYVEPYAGGLQVLLRKDPSKSEVVNDINLGLTNFWRVLRDPEAFSQLVRLCDATPFNEQDWEDAKELLEETPPSKALDVPAAWAFFVMVRQSRQGLCKNFATLSRTRTRGGINEQASAWLGAIDGLAEAHERLKGVVVLSRPALDVIRQQDGPDTWFYLDPPYHPDVRKSKEAYEHEMTDRDHIDLLCELDKIKGKFTLSGYRCELYDDAAEMCGWQRVDREIPNHSSGSKSKEKKTESLWMNY